MIVSKLETGITSQDDKDGKRELNPNKKEEKVFHDATWHVLCQILEWRSVRMFVYAFICMFARGSPPSYHSPLKSSTQTCSVHDSISGKG